MAIGKGSRVEFNGPSGKMFGLVFAMARGEAKVLADTGATLRGDPTQLRESTKPIPADHPSRKFVKGDRIEFQNSSFEGWKPGRVAKIDEFGFMQIATDDGQTWKNVLASKARATSIPVPEHVAKAPVSYAKGARVEFEDNGKTLYGVVSKGGSGRIEVVEDGGIVVHRGPVAAFRPSSHPLNTGGPDEMDRWSVVSYKLHERMSQETPCFEAVIALNGKKVIAATNEGSGGPDLFHGLPGASNDVVERLEADAKAWAIRFDEKAADRRYSEDASSWIDWEVNKKPYGVPAKDYFDDHNRALEAMSSKSFSLR
jgi:hypothetical protein